MAKPIISWYNSTHSSQIQAPFDFGVIDAGDLSPIVTFNIWNNKEGQEDVSKMEDCTITTRDLSGGLGNTVGQEVKVVSGNWFHAQVDSLGETDLTDESSRIGADYSKALGTTGTTKHRKSLSAQEWVANKSYTIGEVVSPPTANGFVYECTTAGTSGAVAPTFTAAEGATVNDGTIVWTAIKINHTPSTKEILGVANDGTPANSAGNFTTVTLQCDVPLDADSGRQNFKLRVSYRYV